MSEEAGHAAAPVADDALAKYKKLLSIARQSLESNQKKMADKDKAAEQLGQQVEQLSRQRDQLRQALESELSSKSRQGGAQGQGQGQAGDEDVSSRPRRVLRRVHAGERLWLLLEYPDAPSAWLSFGAEQEAQDYLSRLAGEPLGMPHTCFTPEESYSLVIYSICII
jgi:hypothetical protein